MTEVSGHIDKFSFGWIKKMISMMYKKLHKTETVTSLEPKSHKGSFLWCVPERVII